MATTKRNMTNGMWKFKKSVPESELIKIAEEWIDGPDGDNYYSLLIRQCSSDQIAIWFIYMRKDESKASDDQFREKITDQLKRRFGNDFVGWDVCSYMTRVLEE